MGPKYLVTTPSFVSPAFLVAVGKEENKNSKLMLRGFTNKLAQNMLSHRSKIQLEEHCLRRNCKARGTWPDFLEIVKKKKNTETRDVLLTELEFRSTKDMFLLEFVHWGCLVIQPYSSYRKNPSQPGLSKTMTLTNSCLEEHLWSVSKMAAIGSLHVNLPICPNNDPSLQWEPLKPSAGKSMCKTTML